jgi:hypothetical protein
MTDKERILIKIIKNLYSTFISKMHVTGWGSANYEDHVHFAPWDKENIKKGALVLCYTSGVHDYSIGILKEKIGYSRALIREIGTNRICDIDNESFIPIKNMQEIELLEKDKYIIYCKILKAFNRGDEYWYRFGGVKFCGKNIVEIIIRERFGGLLNPSKPFNFKMKYNKKTTIKSILENMYDNGYGKRDFERLNNEH